MIPVLIGAALVLTMLVGVGAGAGAIAAIMAAYLDQSLSRPHLLTRGAIGGAIISLFTSINIAYHISKYRTRKPYGGGTGLIGASSVSIAFAFVTIEMVTVALSSQAIHQCKLMLILRICC
jgi:hypothetical protein